MYLGNVSSYFFCGENRVLTYFLLNFWPSGPACIKKISPIKITHSGDFFGKASCTHPKTGLWIIA